MKKVLMTFAALAMIASVASCRETEKKTDEAAPEAPVEAAAPEAPAEEAAPEAAADDAADAAEEEAAEVTEAQDADAN